MKYSVTQGGILIAVLGTLAVQYMGSHGISDVCSNEIAANIPLVIGGITAWIGRIRAKTPVSISGFHKS
jgi:hypothetical protein